MSISFVDIAVKYLENLGYEPYLCKDEDEDEDEARAKEGKDPRLFTSSDTTGEKDFEEFFTDAETLDMNRFENLGVIKNKPPFDEVLLNEFEMTIKNLKIETTVYKRADIRTVFLSMLPDFGHKETGKYLDSKM